MKTLAYNLSLVMAILLLTAPAYAQPWQQLGSDIDGEAPGDFSGNSTSLSADGYTVVVGAHNNDGAGVDAGHVRIYRYNGSSWLQLGSDIDGEAAGDGFGSASSVNFDGNTVAIGAPYNDGNGIDAGHVRIYRYNGSSWLQLGSDIDGETAGDWSGNSVSISADGNTVAIGAKENSFSTGHVRIYRYNGSSWLQLGSDIDGDANNDRMGFSTSISSDGDTIAAGAVGNDGNGNNAGLVRVYYYNGVVWQQVGNDIQGEVSGDNTGGSISISADGSVIAIGAAFNDGFTTNAGHVRVFYLDGAIWQQLGNDIDGIAFNDRFGSSVGISADGNTFAAGAISNDDNGSSSGHVRVFSYNGATWQQLGVNLNGEAAGDRSGFSSSISSEGYTVSIGANQNDGNGVDAGHVRVYDICIPTASTDTIKVCDSTYLWIDSVTYASNNTTATHLLVNSRGCDSLVTLNLSINSSVSSTDTQTACDSFIWIDSVNYTSSNNTATHLLTTTGGCDSLVALNLTISNNNTGTDTRTECDSVVWLDGNTYSANNNTATFTLSNVNGCDSLVTLDLSIINSSSSTDVQMACDTFVWIDGNTYTSNNNIATHALTNTIGCDSMVTLNLTVSSSSSSTDIKTACDSLIWLDGNTYTSNNNSAIFTIAGGNINGCDSVVTLNLTINSNVGTDVQTICDTSYIWIDGNTYTSNNSSATHTLTNSTGCDSVVTLNLTINNNNITGTDTRTECTSYSWIDGNTYNSSNNVGTFNIIGGSASGCDSLVLLDLTIINVDTSITITDPVLTSNATGVAYQWLNCDSNFAFVVGATNQVFNPTINGNYAVEIIDNGCIDTSSCINISLVGIKDNTLFNDLYIFPNPNYGVVNVSLGSLRKVTLKIFDVTGQLIDSITNINTSLYEFKFDKTPGVYLIEIIAEGKKRTYKLLKK